MLFKLLEDARSDDLKTNLLILQLYGLARKNFRNEIYSEYKANRAEAPDDLAPQFEYIRKSVEAFNLPSIELLNYEADISLLLIQKNYSGRSKSYGNIIG